MKQSQDLVTAKATKAADYRRTLQEVATSGISERGNYWQVFSEKRGVDMVIK